MQYQTRNILEWLRQRGKSVRPNNLKINDWVGEYIEKCVLNGKPVEILTQYCLSKDLAQRYHDDGNRFLPLVREYTMFINAIPSIIEMFTTNNVSVNWYVTFNNSFLDRGRISEEVVDAYMAMIADIARSKEIILLNWEKDVLSKRPEPNDEVMKNFWKLVPQNAFDLDMKNLLERVRQYPSFAKTEAELREEAMFKIACEAEEGRFIFSSEAPFSNGDILITPLEFPERLVFFETVTPDFQKRIVPILELYPWRRDGSNLQYTKGESNYSRADW